MDNALFGHNSAHLSGLASLYCSHSHHERLARTSAQWYNGGIRSIDDLVGHACENRNRRRGRGDLRLLLKCSHLRWVANSFRPGLFPPLHMVPPWLSPCSWAWAYSSPMPYPLREFFKTSVPDSWVPSHGKHWRFEWVKHVPFRWQWFADSESLPDRLR